MIRSLLITMFALVSNGTEVPGSSPSPSRFSTFLSQVWRAIFITYYTESCFKFSPFISLWPNIVVFKTWVRYRSKAQTVVAWFLSSTFAGVTATIRSLNCVNTWKRAQLPPGRKSARCPWRRSGCNCQGTPADRPGSMHVSGLSSRRQPHSGAVGGIVNRQKHSNLIYKLDIFQ